MESDNRIQITYAGTPTMIANMARWMIPRLMVSAPFCKAPFNLVITFLVLLSPTIDSRYDTCLRTNAIASTRL
jgi:hypothetical protein